MTFFSILFILIGVNAVMMFMNLNDVDGKIKESSNSISETSVTKIYPIDLIPSKYKKAV